MLGILLFGCATYVPDEEPEELECTGQQPETACENSTHLQEWECVEGEWTPIFTYCAPGCENAACIVESTLPDEEETPKGCADDEPAPDCMDENHLVTWNCVDNQWVGTTDECEFGCHEGACLEKTGIKLELQGVVVTKEIEVKGTVSEKYKNVTLSDENKKLVLVTVVIDNYDDMWLKTATYTLKDNKGDTFQPILSVKSTEGTYSLENIKEFDGINLDKAIPPKSSAVQKYLFQIHKDNRPVELKINYELKPEEDGVTEGYDSATFGLE